jgi:hypothetical protein
VFCAETKNNRPVDRFHRFPVIWQLHRKFLLRITRRSSCIRDKLFAQVFRFSDMGMTINNHRQSWEINFTLRCEAGPIKRFGPVVSNSLNQITAHN